MYQKQKPKKKKSKHGKMRHFLFFVFKIALFCLFLVISFIFLLFVYYAKDLPRPEKFTERTLPQSTKILDRTGKVVLYEIYGEEKRIYKPISEIPQHVINAVIAAEDINFYKHIGIDLKGIIRSVLINLKIKKPVYGGSTISQQLIRSTFLGLEKTAGRKIKEIILTLELERKYSKEQILEWYLNQVPFGQNSYGIETASQTYFQKSISETSIPEAVTLIALIQAPYYLSPYGPNLKKLLIKKDTILERMAKAGFVSKDEVEKLKKEEINFVKPIKPIKAPHFSLLVKDYLEKKYGENFLKEKGLKVYTTLDWQMQEIAEKTVLEFSEKNASSFRAFNAALVAINPNSGEVLAMVGSKNWFADPYPKGCIPGDNCLFEPYPNVALLERQPGSAFKPFVYVTAFEKGFSDNYVVIDELTNFGVFGGKPYIPQNYDGKFHGPVTLRQALAQSLNVPSVKVLAYLAGLENSIKMAQKMGITSLTKPPSFYGLPIVLGGGEVKLFDMVSAYGVFANKGFYIKPSYVLKIEDYEGNIIEENKKDLKRVIEEKSALLITDILSDNKARAPIFGYNSPLYFDKYKVAVKTGSTQNFKDAWVIGYTSKIVVGVWVGNNNNTPMVQAPGVSAAAPLWHSFLEKVLPSLP